jgi:chromosome segregation ATPase
VNKTVRVLLVVALAVMVGGALGGCTQQQKAAVDTAKQNVDQTTSANQASVDATLNAVQDKVKQLASAAGGLEGLVNGLQVNSDLQEIQRKLTAAIGEAGDKKKAAIDELSTAFNNLIAKVDGAAAKLPQGGPVQTKLTDFSAKLRSAQTSLTAAAASVNASSTP